MITKASPARILVKYLINQGVLFANSSNSKEWKTTWSSFPPNSVDNFVVIYDTTAVLVGTEQRSGKTHRYEGIQVRTRGLDYDIGFNKSKELEAALSHIRYGTYVTLTDVPAWKFHLRKFVLKTPTLKILEEDQNLRQHFTINGLLVGTEKPV